MTATFALVARPLTRALSRQAGRGVRLPPRGERHDIVQMLIRRLEEAAQIARRLADTLLVLDERETQIALAILAEALARGDGDIRLLDEEL